VIYSGQCPNEGAEWPNSNDTDGIPAPHIQVNDVVAVPLNIVAVFAKYYFNSLNLMCFQAV